MIAIKEKYIADNKLNEFRNRFEKVLKLPNKYINYFKKQNKETLTKQLNNHDLSIQRL